MNTHATYLMAFFSLFFVTAQCCFNDFTLEQFEMITESENGDFAKSNSFTNEQKEILFFLHDKGNLIRLMLRYYGLQESNPDRESVKAQASTILNNLLKVEFFDQSYTALNTGLLDTRTRNLDLLKKYINQETTDLERLTDKTFVKTLNHSSLVDEHGNTGLMLAAQTGNKKVLKYFLQAYIAQNCPLHAKNIDGKSVYNFVADTSVIDKIVKKQSSKITKHDEHNCLVM